MGAQQVTQSTRHHMDLNKVCARAHLRVTPVAVLAMCPRDPLLRPVRELVMARDARPSGPW